MECKLKEYRIIYKRDKCRGTGVCTKEIESILKLSTSSHNSDNFCIRLRLNDPRLRMLRQLSRECPAGAMSIEKIQDNIKLDSGYFLIRTKEKIIEVAYCKTKSMQWVFSGNTPEGLYKEILGRLRISAEHAAYLGSELQKAYNCIKSNKKYVQT